MLFAATIGGYLAKRKHPLLQAKQLLRLGVIIPILYWTGQIIGSLLYGDYSFQQQGPMLLNSFYSNSGNFMAILNLLLAILSLAFFMGSFTSSKSLTYRTIPLLPIGFITISMLGKTLFPSPHPLAIDFDQVYLLSMLGPILSLFLWRKDLDKDMRILCYISLLLMLIPTALFISRSFPEFMFSYAGIFQGIIHAGWTLWFIGLALFLTKSHESAKLPLKVGLHKTQVL